MTAGALISELLPDRTLLPDGAAGIDAGMTLTKTARATGDGVAFEAYETGTGANTSIDDATITAVTGALLREPPTGAHAVPEIEAAARGVVALMASAGRSSDGDFLIALLGTGTAFIAMRDGAPRHLGGTPLGGGSFAGIARRIDPSLSYAAMIEGAARGDRTRVDTMIADVYPEGIGGVSAAQTAAHLSRAAEGSLDDFLAGLLNLHGENIAQIAAGRAMMARTMRIVLAGGFVHDNGALVSSIASMAGLFGMQVEVVPQPGFAGALGAALLAVETARTVSGKTD